MVKENSEDEKLIKRSHRTMKKSGKLGAAALLLCGTLALSAMGMGFAK